MTAPARDQLWVAESTPDGKLVVERKDGNRWRLYRLPVTVDAWEGATISGSARDDVWVVAGRQLWRFQGRGWTQVALPAGTTATAVTDVPGPTVYVGLHGDATNTGVHTLRNGSWKNLGRPSDEGVPYAPLYSPREIRVVDGTVFANWQARQRNSSVFWASFVYRGGAWTSPFGTFSTGSGTYARRGPWLVPDPATQLYLGSGGPEPQMPWYAHCYQWTKSSGQTGCTTRWAAGAGAVLSDGRMVIGGDDYKHGQDPKVEATFGIRTLDGRETVVPGDPGDRTRAMAVMPGTGDVWAATERNGVDILQSWDR